MRPAATGPFLSSANKDEGAARNNYAKAVASRCTTQDRALKPDSGYYFGSASQQLILVAK